MRAIRVPRYGEPSEVAECHEVPEPPLPGPGEVRVAMEFAPIHPSDLLMLRGRAGNRPSMVATQGVLPAPLGTEGVGRVTDVGDGVSDVQIGDRVVTPFNEPSWLEQMTISAAGLFPLPADIDPAQLSMLTINPLTALVLLEEFVTLQAGEWVIQNAANSAVGRTVIAIARRRGYRTLNVVRRGAVASELSEMGADVVLVDGEDLPDRVTEATGGAEVRLALDAVAGHSTTSLSGSLTDEGTLVSYGAMSGSPCSIPARQLIVKSLTLKGFWLVDWWERTGAKARAESLKRLLPLFSSGELRLPVEATYPLDEPSAALKDISRAKGKILFHMNGG